VVGLISAPFRRQRILAISTGLLATVFWALVEWRFSLTAPYFRDILTAIAASGATRRGLIVVGVGANVLEFLLVFAAFGILILRKAVRWLDVLFFGFICAAGLAIINQNAQSQHIVILLVVILWSYSIVLRKSDVSNAPASASSKGDVRVVALLLLLFIVPRVIYPLHGIFTITNGLASSPQQRQVTNLPGVYIGDVKSYLDTVHVDADPITLFNETRARSIRNLSQGEYAETIDAGVRILEANNIRSGKIFIVDQANPFNFLTGGEPPRGDYSWIDAGRNFDGTVHLPAPILFHDVEHIMMPVFPMNYWTSKGIRAIYGKYVAENYALLAHDRFWTLYHRMQ
jgi:hypothetical protein